VILAGILLKLGGYGMIRACFPIVPRRSTSSPYALGVIGVVLDRLRARSSRSADRLQAHGRLQLGQPHGLRAARPRRADDLGDDRSRRSQMFNHGTSSAVLFLVVGVIYDRAHHRDLQRFGGLAADHAQYWALTTLGFFAALGPAGARGLRLRRR
jgi:NADH-quinone oxidoreductase subunit M